MPQIDILRDIAANRLSLTTTRSADNSQNYEPNLVLHQKLLPQMGTYKDPLLSSKLSTGPLSCSDPKSMTSQISFFSFNILIFLWRTH